MNHPMNPNTIPQPSSTDGFFGMALAQAFMGMAFGAGAEQLWIAGETLDAVYTDRYDQKRTNGRVCDYKLGAKKSLAETFSRMTESTIAETERNFFRPSYAKPSFAL